MKTVQALAAAAAITCVLAVGPLEAQEAPSAKPQAQTDDPAAPTEPATAATDAEIDGSGETAQANESAPEKKPEEPATDPKLAGKEAKRIAANAALRAKQARDEGKTLVADRLANLSKQWERVSDTQQKAAAVEAEATQIEKGTLKLKTKARRARSLVEQTEARRARALARLKQLGLVPPDGAAPVTTAAPVTGAAQETTAPAQPTAAPNASGGATKASPKKNPAADSSRAPASPKADVK